ncbi:MAG TPA: FAD-linked oxidase C-terminal domain-containing protein [Pelobium sp.]|nr:FAD-linked oxidase C-terminal domain-containing protein [Pelobium sp.]
MNFDKLLAGFKGDFFYNDTASHQSQILAYATDASVYQEKPLAVALPKCTEDVKQLIKFALANNLTLIPRAAGTSLAGQVVGNGVVVDISKHFNKIIEVNTEEKWVKVQPGVIRDDLNSYLKSSGLMFGPETSTANRAMIGGMVGNNSCGLHSMVWGAVRDHLLEVSVILSDGSEAVFNNHDYTDKGSVPNLKNSIVGSLIELLSDSKNQDTIVSNAPKPSVLRRNTGYALDAMLDQKPFNPQGKDFNLCSLIAGSEGTLAFITEIKIQLIELPPKEVGVVCIHTKSIDEALRANIIAVAHRPMASELVDKYICDFTIGHPEYHKYRSFIVGNPEAILMVEFMEDDKILLELKAKELINALKLAGYGYAFPVLFNGETKSAWEIRKAGLGLLRNLKGKEQPVNLIEDCAVSTDDLPDYINDLQLVLEKYQVKASYYAHAGAGELHVEPLINLKSAEGIAKFRGILTDTVALVKKYKGSLSGEHGDGRLRGEFIKDALGQETYQLFESVKSIFDPKGVFNRGKITNSPAMDTHLRVVAGQKDQLHKTYFDFSENDGIQRLTEKCSGSGDCRKSAISGGVMCPSYMATRLEKHTTRARANVLRQFLSNEHDRHPFAHEEIKEIMDLCISCKGCKTECPSGVDVAKLKAEFLQNYYDTNGASFRAKLIANFSSQMRLASWFKPIFNGIYQSKTLTSLANKLVGFHPDRSVPLISKTTLRKWYKKRQKDKPRLDKKVFLFCDEFTNYNDAEIGKTAILLLEGLGYEVSIPDHLESGRTFLSKGFLKKASVIINKNIQLLSPIITAESPLIGIEPSAILTFRDEYKDLAKPENKGKAIALAKNVYTIEEFLANEFNAGRISSESFSMDHKELLLHGHCYQKALSSQKYLTEVLAIPENYKTVLIPSGCCGMAGSFGYEEEHFEVSQQIGELVLYPAIREMESNQILVTSGTSCRHQIKDATAVKALHPVEVLYQALIEK